MIRLLLQKKIPKGHVSGKRAELKVALNFALQSVHNRTVFLIEAVFNCFPLQPMSHTLTDKTLQLEKKRYFMMSR